jgi:hypothetical protein
MQTTILLTLCSAASGQVEVTTCCCADQLCSCRPETCTSVGGKRATAPHNTAHSARVGFNFYTEGNPSCVRLSNIFAHHTTEIGVVYAREGLNVEAEDILLADNRHVVVCPSPGHSKPFGVPCSTPLERVL